MSRPVDSWAAEVMAYAMAHPAGVARRRAPKASRPVRSAPAAVQAPKAEPAPEPLAVEAPAAMAEPVEAEPVSQVVQLRPAGSAYREMLPSDVRTVETLAKLVRLGAEETADFVRAHLVEIYTVVRSTPNREPPEPFEPWSANILEQLEQGKLPHLKAVKAMAQQGRDVLAEGKSREAESQLAAASLQFRYGFNRWTLDGTAQWARAVEAVSALVVQTIGFQIPGEYEPVAIDHSKLRAILACRKRWTEWMILLDSNAIRIDYKTRYGKGSLTLVRQAVKPTVCVMVGQANDNAKAA